MGGLKKVRNIFPAVSRWFSKSGIYSIPKGQSKTQEEPYKTQAERGLQVEQGELTRFWFHGLHGVPSDRTLQIRGSSKGFGASFKKVEKIAVKIVIWTIKFYQRWISPFFPSTCRFYPTCSQYAIEALGKYGLLKGGLMSIWRVLRCNPFNPGGYDPVR